MRIFNSLDYFKNSIFVFRYYPKKIASINIIITHNYYTNITQKIIFISNFNIGKTLNGVAIANFLDPSSAKFRK